MQIAINRPEVGAMTFGIVAWHKTLSPAGDVSIVLRESGFGNAVAKTNLMAIRHHGRDKVQIL